MYLNPTVFLTFSLAAAIVVGVHSWRRRKREAESPEEFGHEAGEDDWDNATPDPVRWTALVLVLAPLALPAYFVRARNYKVAAPCVLLAILAVFATLRHDASYELRNPMALAKPVAWSKFPPGLPEAVRQATEQLPDELATQVIDILPALIEVGRSYPEGADISVTPGDDEAQVLMRITRDGYDVMAALRIYPARNRAKAVMKDETNVDDRQQLKSSDGRVVVLLGPRADPSGPPGGEHHLQLYECYGDVLAHLFVRERITTDIEFSPARRKALQQEATSLARKLATELPVAH